MKRILISGTCSVHTYNFIDLIKDDFDDLWLVTDRTNDARPDIKQVVIESSLKRPLSFFSDIRKLRKLFNDKPPDLIHTQQLDTLAYAVTRAFVNKSTPVVATAWGSDLLLVPAMGFLYRKLVRKVLKASTAFTADASFVGSKIHDFPEGKGKPVEIVNFGIDLIKSSYSEKEKIIYSNRLHKKLYNIDKVIRMFAGFSKTEKGSQYRLLIGGTGDETGRLKQLAKDLRIADRTEFVGWLNAKQNAENYRRASVFVSLPSSDGTSISLLEALSAGCVPVLSDLPANREWVKNGENGVIVQQGMNGFTAALDLVSEDVFHFNQKLAAEKASKEVNRRKFITLYEQVLSGLNR